MAQAMGFRIMLFMAAGNEESALSIKGGHGMGKSLREPRRF